MEFYIEKDKYRPWAYVPQEFTSKNTSMNFGNRLPKIFSLFKENKIIIGKTNLDLGSGRYFVVHNWLFNKGVINYQYDPYNLPPELNALTINIIKNQKMDTVTISNVLNVIKEEEVRLQILANACYAVKEDGVVYISTYNSFKKGKTCNGYQNGFKKEKYLNEIKEFFDVVEIKYGILIARKPNKKLIFN